MDGYKGIGPEAGTFVPKEKAYDYALGRCLPAFRTSRRNSGKCWWSGIIPGTGLRRIRLIAAENRDYSIGHYERRAA